MIAWQSAEITIPLKDIINITTNDILLKKLDHVVYIGIPSLSKKKVIIKIKKFNYVLYTNNISEMINEINIYLI
ncbi:SunI/YnzG family protein [Bacillus cereus group sp. Bce010]|uniref:SunI/YnzG family protein n=1 Tax=Bacillus cereus group TaxID=86661 RepID=UPI0035A87273